MSELDDRKSLLPKGRTIPINGDVVRSRRILGGWSSPREFAVDLDMSEDRLIEIEKGGARVYAKTFVAIANLLNVDWDLLVDNKTKPNAKEQNPQASGYILAVVINSANINEFDDEKILKLVEKLKQAAGLKGEISIISVDDGSILITLGLSEADTIQLVSAFCQGKLDRLGFTEIRLAGIRYVWEQLRKQYEIVSNAAEITGKNPAIYSDVFDKSIIDKISHELKEKIDIKYYIKKYIEFDYQDDESGGDETKIDKYIEYTRNSSIIMHTALSGQVTDVAVAFDYQGVLTIARTGLGKLNQAVAN